MSEGRSGYSDDCTQQELALWRGTVRRAIRGKRGQALIRDLRDALDAMPEKRLIADELVKSDGTVCALGCVGVARGISDLDSIDPENHYLLASLFNIAPCLVKEIEYENDEGNWMNRETPENRWAHMRRWCDSNLIGETP